MNYKSKKNEKKIEKLVGVKCFSIVLYAQNRKWIINQTPGVIDSLKAFQRSGLNMIAGCFMKVYASNEQSINVLTHCQGSLIPGLTTKKGGLQADNISIRRNKNHTFRKHFSEQYECKKLRIILTGLQIIIMLQVAKSVFLLSQTCLYLPAKCNSQNRLFIH